ncbi:peroxide stress protein YaaA [Thorsellia kenyensis]|uniref:UPF0246 protein ACFFIT_11340 n=1 Tax=Thorsellia kenyensis TaxID=1549888 RepID=A0ABV6CCH0_9GAMM
MSLLILISPAKTLDYESDLPSLNYSEPQFLDNSEALIEVCKELAPDELARLMKISDKLASLNVARFASWEKSIDFTVARQAIFAFQGDVYQGLNASSLTEQDLLFAQNHLKILSGLYGILRPLDLMRPYRLEMGTKLQNKKGKNLYEFWGTLLTQYINDYAKKGNIEYLVNLASDEYFNVIKPKLLNIPIIKPVFLDEKNGQFKTISFYAKRARGLMSRYIITNKIVHKEALKAFNIEGYSYSKDESSDGEYVFKRNEIIG